MFKIDFSAQDNLSDEYEHTERFRRTIKNYHKIPVIDSSTGKYIRD